MLAGGQAGPEEDIEAGGVAEGEVAQVDHDLVGAVRAGAGGEQGLSELRGPVEVDLAVGRLPRTPAGVSVGLGADGAQEAAGFGCGRALGDVDQGDGCCSASG